MAEIVITKGGAGSGHHAHRGRPGERGGSLPAGVAGSPPTRTYRSPSGSEWRMSGDSEGFILPDAKVNAIIQKMGAEYGSWNADQIVDATQYPRNTSAWLMPNGKVVPVDEHWNAVIVSDLRGKGGMATLLANGFVRINYSLARGPFGEGATLHLELDKASLTRTIKDALTDIYWGATLTPYGRTSVWLEADVFDDEGIALKAEGITELNSLLGFQVNKELKGGAGSGHYGHRGRPGEVGGSRPRGAPADLSNISEEAQKGECFVCSARFVMDSEDDAGLTLVHGTVAGQGRLEGIRFVHSWVETGDIVIDPTQNVVMQKERYYEVGMVKDVFKYDRDEMLKNLLKFEHWGPWEDYLNEGPWEEKGGPGSGHEGHAGRPGERGGSLPRGATAPKTETEYRVFNDPLVTRDYEDYERWDDAYKGQRQKYGYRTEEGKALAEYSQISNEELNNGLRKGEDDPYIAKRVELIDRVMKEGRTPEAGVLYRGGQMPEGLKVGDVFYDSAYVSTSMSKDVALDFVYDELGDVGAGDGLMEIRVPKGLKSVFMRHYSNIEDEFEILLPRRLKYKVVEITDEGMVLEITK